jgi:hypothetical protein
MKRIILTALCLLSIGSFQIALAGDYLNEQEVERVREAQEIDKRVEVLLRIAERRLNALLGAPIADKPVAKEKKEKKKDKDKDKDVASDDYGPEPSGTVTELLDNYSKVISEMLDKIDDSYDKKKDDPKLAKAISKILDSAPNHIKRLDQVRPSLKSDTEETAFEKAMEIAKMAIDGARDFKVK